MQLLSARSSFNLTKIWLKMFQSLLLFMVLSARALGQKNGASYIQIIIDQF